MANLLHSHVFQRHQKSTMKILYNENPSHFKSIFCCYYAMRGVQRIAFNGVARIHQVFVDVREKPYILVYSHYVEAFWSAPALTLFLPLELTFSRSLSFGGNINSTTAHHLDNGFVTYFAFSAQRERERARFHLHALVFAHTCTRTGTHVHGWLSPDAWLVIAFVTHGNVIKNLKSVYDGNGKIIILSGPKSRWSVRFKLIYWLFFLVVYGERMYAILHILFEELANDNPQKAPVSIAWCAMGKKGGDMCWEWIKKPNEILNIYVLHTLKSHELECIRFA